MGRPKPDEGARYVIKYKATRTWFYSVPTSTTTVTGDKARKATTQAIRDGGGQVVSVRKRGWLW